TRGKLVFGVSRDCHAARFGRMFELSVTPLLSNLRPAVSFNHADDLTDGHGSRSSGLRLRKRQQRVISSICETTATLTSHGSIQPGFARQEPDVAAGARAVIDPPESGQ